MTEEPKKRLAWPTMGKLNDAGVVEQKKMNLGEIMMRKSSRKSGLTRSSTRRGSIMSRRGSIMPGRKATKKNLLEDAPKTNLFPADDAAAPAADIKVLPAASATEPTAEAPAAKVSFAPTAPATEPAADAPAADAPAAAIPTAEAPAAAPAS